MFYKKITTLSSSGVIISFYFLDFPSFALNKKIFPLYSKLVDTEQNRLLCTFIRS